MKILYKVIGTSTFENLFASENEADVKKWIQTYCGIHNFKKSVESTHDIEIFASIVSGQKILGENIVTSEFI